MRTFTLLLMLPLLAGCSFRQWYPTLGSSAAGATAAALGGGPLAVGLASGGGALAGEVARGNADLEEAQETITALTHGDVEALLEKRMEKHTSVFESFTTTIKRILLIAACILVVYLAIPIFVAKQCSKSEVQRGLTRAPFPPPKP
jgi:hypothetical protein